MRFQGFLTERGACSSSSLLPLMGSSLLQQEAKGACSKGSLPACFQAEPADVLWDARDAPVSSVGAGSLCFAEQTGTPNGA